MGSVINRKNYLSLLRIVAMFAVMAIHICTTAITDFPQIGSTSLILYRSIISLLHFSVPIFFMITGALMLDPKRGMSLNKFLKKYVLKYAAVILVFAWGFAFTEEVFNSREISLKEITASFIGMLKGNSWAHMWYMYSLLGVILLVPILREVVKRTEKTFVNYVMFIGIIFLSILPVIQNYTGFRLGIAFPINGIYCLYMLVGYWIDNGQINIVRNKILLFILGFISLVGLSAISVIYNIKSGFGNYDSPIILLYSILIFVSFRDLQPVLGKLACEIDRLSFGTYIIHMFWINLLYKFLNINPFTLVNPFLGFLLLWGIVSVLSLLTSYVLNKMPLIKKLV